MCGIFNETFLYSIKESPCGQVGAHWFFQNAGVAQPVEQLIRNQQVRCSSHPTSSKTRRNFKLPAGFTNFI